MTVNVLFFNLSTLMYTTEGVSQIATITELRSETAEVLDAAQKEVSGIMIQKNNEPTAALIGWETYKALKRIGAFEEIKEAAGEE
jgi:prevent-host-death family protein